MRLPLQTKGYNRLASKAPIKSDITPTQLQNHSLRARRHLPIFLPPGEAIGVAPRPCVDCDLLFLACRAAGLPDLTCIAEERECRITSCNVF